MTNKFLSKARTLTKLQDRLENWKIPYSHYFRVEEWEKNKNKIINLISKNFDHKIIIRSSSIYEDKKNKSNAGKFLTISNVENKPKIIATSVNKVISSYKSNNKKNEVLIQNYIVDSKESGVIFTSDQESGQPYFKINFTKELQNTNNVTSGKKNTELLIYFNGYNNKHIPNINLFNKNIFEGIDELLKFFKKQNIDIEYLIDSKNNLYLLQVRELVTNKDKSFSKEIISSQIKKGINKYNRLKKKKNNLIGNTTFFSNMTDWNPAEILGKYPKNLSVDIYKYLITNTNWSKQRSEYGYQNIKGNLLQVFCGQPYIDIRLVINSFIPKNLSFNARKNLFYSYYKLLKDNTKLYDKLEFDVVFTVWTNDFNNRIKKRLNKYGFNKIYIQEIEKNLKEITKNALVRLKLDIEPIKKLIINRNKIINSNKSPINKFSKLLIDCKKNGTLPFAHAARAAFVSIELLKNFVLSGDLSLKRYNLFLSSINTISNEIEKKINLFSNNKIQLTQLLNEFGHLRPGTYEIENFSYSEKPNIYLRKINKTKIKKIKTFRFTKKEKLSFKFFLKKINSDLSEDDLINFFYSSINERELVKFEFTKNISIGFDYLIAFLKTKGIKRKDLSYLNLTHLLNYKNSISTLRKNIHKNKIEFKKDKAVLLPDVIKQNQDFFFFKYEKSIPNFVTDKKVIGSILFLTNKINKLNHTQINNKIILIENADPGFDWIFAYKIKALVTKFGGANSHMAIRAFEKNLPSVIGVGEKIFKEIEKKHIIKIDCINKKVLIIE